MQISKSRGPTGHSGSIYFVIRNFGDYLTHVIDSEESCLEPWIVVELIMCVIKFMTLLNKTSKENWKEIYGQKLNFLGHI